MSVQELKTCKYTFIPPIECKQDDEITMIIESDYGLHPKDILKNGKPISSAYIAEFNKMDIEEQDAST
ncbi:MAG: hypothetical protein ACFFG0_08170 [Candidatus Thorarchaeota archaeon]